MKTNLNHPPQYQVTTIPSTNEEIQFFLGHYFGQEKFSGNLHRVEKMAKHLDLTNVKNAKVITVVGTNGKGQVTRELSELLTTEGFHVCRFTSPHYLEVRERMWANGDFITNQELGKICFELMEKLKLLEMNHCSFFEFIFLVFLTWIKKINFNFIILEVGLGGRLDATKIIPADYVLLTSISRDHVGILGHSFKSILMEKLGILSDKSKLFYHLELNYLKDLTKKYLIEKKIQGYELKINDKALGQTNFSRTNRLLIEFFWEKVFQKKFPQYEWRESQFFYQAKIQNCEFYFFPSHNLDGIRKLFQFLKQKNYNQTSQDKKLLFDATFMGFSQRPHWEVESILKLVFLQKALLGKIGLASFDHEKCFKDFHLLSKLVLSELESQKISCHHYSSYFGHFSHFDHFGEIFFSEQKRILVFGSNYFIGELRKFLGT